MDGYWPKTFFTFLIDRDEVEQAWSIKDLLFDQKENFYLRDQRGKS